MAASKAAKKSSKKPAEPVRYSDELAEAICERIANGESILRITKQANMPSHTSWYRWLESNEELRDKYARARQRQQDVYAQQIIDIADASDDTNAQSSKLRIEARKWHAGKVAPKKWGNAADPANHITINTSKPLEEMTDDELDAFIASRQDAK